MAKIYSTGPQFTKEQKLIVQAIAENAKKLDALTAKVDELLSRVEPQQKTVRHAAANDTTKAKK